MFFFVRKKTLFDISKPRRLKRFEITKTCQKHSFCSEFSELFKNVINLGVTLLQTPQNQVWKLLTWVMIQISHTWHSDSPIHSQILFFRRIIRTFHFLNQFGDPAATEPSKSSLNAGHYHDSCCLPSIQRSGGIYSGIIYFVFRNWKTRWILIRNTRIVIYHHRITENKVNSVGICTNHDFRILSSSDRRAAGGA